MKILLVIGGTGYFGKSLLQYLDGEKNNKFNIKKVILVSRNRKTVDKTKYLKVENIFKNIKNIKKIPDCNFVIYAATSKNNSEDLLCLNRFINLIKKKKKKPKILFTSSGAVYGKVDKKKLFLETDEVNFYNVEKFTNYKKNYAKTKIKMENIFKNLTKLNYKVSIARCFTFIGKDLLKNKSYAISSIFNDAVNKKAIYLKSKNSVFRSYMHSYDLAVWLMKMLVRANNKCSIYNLGSDQYVSLDKVAKIIGKIFKKPIVYLKKTSEIDSYLPDVKKAKKELNLKITINLEKAINKLKQDEELKNA